MVDGRTVTPGIQVWAAQRCTVTLECCGIQRKDTREEDTEKVGRKKDRLHVVHTHKHNNLSRTALLYCNVCSRAQRAKCWPLMISHA